MRILLIEDDPKIALNIRKGLEHERYVVDVVHSGVEGLDLAIGEYFDLIILDRMLPDMDGVTICQSIRKENVTTPILMLTALDQGTDVVEGLEAGADDYMVKPFAFTELFARIKAITRRTSLFTLDPTNTMLQVADLQLDTLRHEVTRTDTSIRLSATEFALLEYLMRHADKVISKEQIINHVWSYDADVLPNSIEVYINRLRGKLETPFKGPKLIHTVRSYGYKISHKS